MSGRRVVRALVLLLLAGTLSGVRPAAADTDTIVTGYDGPAVAGVPFTIWATKPDDWTGFLELKQSGHDLGTGVLDGDRYVWTVTADRGDVTYVVYYSGGGAEGVWPVVQGRPNAARIVAGRTTVPYGSTVQLSAAVLHHGDDPGIVIRRATGSSTVAFSRCRFDAAGHCSLFVRPTGTTTYVASYTGDALYDPASAAVTVHVVPTVSFHLGRLGTRLYRFNGTLTPAQAGHVVSLYARQPSGRLAILVSSRTDAAGRYGFSYRFLGSGPQELFARVQPDAGLSQADSSHVRVTVS